MIEHQQRINQNLNNSNFASLTAGTENANGVGKPQYTRM